VNGSRRAGSISARPIRSHRQTKNTMSIKIEYSEMTAPQREQLRTVISESQNIGEGFNRESALRRDDFLTLEMIEIVENAIDPWDAYHSFKARISELERAAFAAGEYGKKLDKEANGKD